MFLVMKGGNFVWSDDPNAVYEHITALADIFEKYELEGTLDTTIVEIGIDGVQYFVQKEQGYAIARRKEGCN